MQQATTTNMAKQNKTSTLIAWVSMKRKRIQQGWFDGVVFWKHKLWGKIIVLHHDFAI
jgi:hypothetical protein